MLDTTDYDFDLAHFYSKYYDPTNVFNRDDLYQITCGSVDFAGSYVSPDFFMSYLSGNYDAVRALSGKQSIKELKVIPHDPPHS